MDEAKHEGLEAVALEGLEAVALPGWQVMLALLFYPGDWWMRWQGDVLLWAGEPIDPAATYATGWDANGRLTMVAGEV